MKHTTETGVDEPVAGAMPQTDRERWIILNPVSGTADHAEQVRELAAERGYRVEETDREGHAAELARRAAAGDVTLLAVAGGDGTLHEVVNGLHDEDALDRITVVPLPVGTENIVANNLDIRSVEQGFDVVETGARRRIDLGVADGELFAMSCIAGLLADASIATSDELKERFGSMAFVVAGLQEMATFDGLQVDLTAVSQGEETRWSGEAVCVLVGNIRRFAKEGGQANVEDGHLEVVIIEQMPTTEMVAEALTQRVLGEETENVFHVRASQLQISTADEETIDFSLDGEPHSDSELILYTHPRSLRVCVGPDYDPSPFYS
ncbi:YegS/Rv2252/BmrU family lipid kinase [Halogeometricum sp. S1BR25-6]|uniref:YegS/Rv2252/BmrU family lipid kinase n=1 Tax=Halogeometricum salsisoli TaxID=2950536 RepID=A0ABU2GDJ3_9EURY|nr:YegS/Rv2252/BmrU family lipid kinase [Halogeometricum sp. S1BR25-6]MDS0298178.1 YegS/Rv2252/BmrU family lipid kinase [Halogeometricum sp. S1BR25-6]